MRTDADVLSNLTEYELLDLEYTVIGNIAITSSLLLTLMFAYITVAYIAGKNISNAQASLLSVPYSFAVLGGIANNYIDQRFAREILMALYGGELASQYFMVLVASVFSFSWLLSLAYMRSVRRNAGST